MGNGRSIGAPRRAAEEPRSKTEDLNNRELVKLEAGGRGVGQFAFRNSERNLSRIIHTA
jgi:hypothetical protein